MKDERPGAVARRIVERVLPWEGPTMTTRRPTEPFASTRIRILSPEAHEIELTLARAGYRRLQTARDGSDLFPRAPRRSSDLVIADLRSPGATKTVLKLAETAEAEPFSVLFVGDEVPEALAGRMLSLPRADFLRTPIQGTELLLRVRTLLRIRWLHARVDRHADAESHFREVSSSLADQRLELLERLARAVEYKDDETGDHPRRIGRIASRTALALGLPEELAELIELAAPLHDIGKIAIPDAILLKPNELEVWEAELMRSHTVVGRQLLEGSDSPVLQMAEGIAFSHHERWDGRGYPVGLHQGSIPIPARITAVADAYDAMSFDRPYRDALPPQRVVERIEVEAGHQFDPSVVEAFLEEALPRIRREGLRLTG